MVPPQATASITAACGFVLPRGRRMHVIGGPWIRRPSMSGVERLARSYRYHGITGASVCEEILCGLQFT